MIVYKVYFENRFISVSPEPDRLQNYILFHRFHNREQLYKIISAFQNQEEPGSINIFGSDIENIWNQFQSYFECAEAGGGLVKHITGHYLFIIRHGKWDLPKGHMEVGETPEQCALREVTEECGIEGQTIVRPLIPSYHTWQYEGVSYLKRTNWFLMDYAGEMTGVPQKDEGITEVHWLKPERICVIRQNAWDSLKDLINTSVLIS